MHTFTENDSHRDNIHSLLTVLRFFKYSFINVSLTLQSQVIFTVTFHKNMTFGKTLLVTVITTSSKLLN